MNAILGSLRPEKHPDKTFIGKIDKGFDFLGYHFSRAGLTVARATIEKFVERAFRLYEQDRKEPSGPSRLDTYVERWRGWVVGGLTWQQVGPDSSQPFGPQLRLLAGVRLS